MILETNFETFKGQQLPSWQGKGFGGQHVPAKCLGCEALLLEMPSQHHGILYGQAYPLTCTLKQSPTAVLASC